MSCNLAIPPRVLVVDDTPANHVAMGAVLAPLDVRIVTASSGAEALERAREQTFAVALIDVQMPQMDGFELARRLRAMPECRELPIVFVTALHRDERFVREGYAMGAADYVTKPFDPDVIRARVRAFVDLFRQRERLRLLEVGERTRERDDALEQLAAVVVRERSARHDAELANAAKDEFIALASHELRTPLTAILGWAILARRMHPPPEIDHALDTIEKNARAQARVVDDLLDLTRSMTGKLQLQLGDVDLDEAIGAAVSALAPLAAQKGVGVDVATTAGTIHGDESRLKQVVSNLVSNAIKFTPNGGRVSVTALRRGSTIEVIVSDTGEGISPDFLPRVFEPFRQADSSPARVHGGLGLGLTITKQLVERHGGKIRVESDGPGRGATFVVELPTVAARVDEVA